MSTQFALIPHTYSFVRSVISLMNPDVRLLFGCCCCHYFRERQGSYPFEVTLTIDFLFDNSLPDVLKVPLFLSQLIHNSYLIRIFQAITNINRFFVPPSDMVLCVCVGVCLLYICMCIYG